VTRTCAAKAAVPPKHDANSAAPVVSVIDQLQHLPVLLYNSLSGNEIGYLQMVIGHGRTLLD
jgi:hypothetical protein